MDLITYSIAACDVVVALDIIVTCYWCCHVLEMVRRVTRKLCFARKSPWSLHLDKRFLLSCGWVCLCMIVSTTVLRFFHDSSRSYLLTLLDFDHGLFVSVAVLVSPYTIARLVFHDSVTHSPEMSQQEIGSRLALGFYAYLENALVNKQWRKKLREKYMENRYTKILPLPPLIVSCDLAAHHEYLSQYRLGLIQGLVKLENDMRRQLSNISEDVVNVLDELPYKYKDKSGYPRTSSYSVCTVKESDATEYYVVCDNRALFTLQIALTSLDEVDVSELKRQQQNLDVCLKGLLESNESLRDNYVFVQVAGDEYLSTAIRRARDDYYNKMKNK